MFIDDAMNSTTRAPAERNVSGNEYATVRFRSSGARGIFWSLRSINITSLRDENRPLPKIAAMGAVATP
jgi:hypothetical protein